MDILKRAVVMAVGSGGDVAPLAAVATKLAERGIDTTLMAPQRYQHFANGTKVSFCPIGAESVFTDVFNGADIWDPAKGLSASWRYYGAAMRTGLLTLRQNWSPSDTTLVSSSFAVGARLAQEVDGYRNTTVHLSPSIVFSAIRPPKWPGPSIPAGWPLRIKRLAIAAAESIATDRIIGAHVNSFRTELGLAPVRRIFSQWLHSPQRVIYAFPEWYAPPADDWPRCGKFAGFPQPASGARVLSPSLDAFLRKGAGPVVVITAGTAVASSPAWVEKITHFAVNRGARVVVVEPNPAAFRQEAMVYRTPFAPFDVLLPRAQLIVHHAGIGTIAEAMRSGLPQLLVPGAHDQPDNAHRLQSLGIGHTLTAHFKENDLLDAWQWSFGTSTLQQKLREIQARLGPEGDGAARVADIVIRDSTALKPNILSV